MSRKFAGPSSTIYFGEAISILRDAIPRESVDLIIADPPYNIGKNFNGFKDRWDTDSEYESWCQQWLTLCVDCLKPSGSMYVMASTQSMPYIDLFLRSKLEILSRIVWHYDSSGMQARKSFGSLYEPILFAVKDKRSYTFNGEDIQVEAKTGAQRKLIDYRKQTPAPYSSTKVPGNVWYFSRVRYRMDEYEEHPAQKPEALIERMIRASSNAGDLVLDLFAGTFTTSAVAQRLGRRTWAIEMQRDYVKIGLRRLGLAQVLDDELLRPPAKSFTRRGMPGGESSLFDP